MENTKTKGSEELIDLAKLTFEEQAYCDLEVWILNEEKQWY